MQNTFTPITAYGGRDYPTGYSLMNNGLLNKGTAYSDAERDALGLRGLLPARIFPIEQQVKRALRNLRAKNSDLNKYIFLNALQNRNETLYYRVVLDHLEEMIAVRGNAMVRPSAESEGCPAPNMPADPLRSDSCFTAPPATGT